MINVAFLLLIFFLMSVVIAPSQPFEVTPPRSVSTEHSDGKAVFLREDGLLFLHNGDLANAAAIRAERVDLLASGDVEATKVARAIQSLRAMGAESIALVADGGSTSPRSE